MQLLNAYQIYFEESQLASIDFIPYYNEDCTPYFENSVICDLINADAHKNSKYFGVLSHKYKSKIVERRSNEWLLLPELANQSLVDYNPEMIEFVLDRFRFPVLNLMQHPEHDPIEFGAKFHRDLPRLFKEVLRRIGYQWNPTVYKSVFYSNYFIARSEIYEHYVKTMLEPAIKVMNDMPELWQNSGYLEVLPKSLQKKWNYTYYPYHSFILERLFSYYYHTFNIIS